MKNNNFLSLFTLSILSLLRASNPLPTTTNVLPLMRRSVSSSRPKPIYSSNNPDHDKLISFTTPEELKSLQLSSSITEEIEQQQDDLPPKYYFKNNIISFKKIDDEDPESYDFYCHDGAPYSNNP